MLQYLTVGACMTSPAVTVSVDESLRVATELLKEYNIRHLPVLKGSKLVGILSSGDIRRASPSDATSLSYWELTYLWDKLTVEQTMSQPVKTVKADTPMVEAVRLMFEHRFSSLPVVDSANHLVGILTETDIFRLFIQMTESPEKLRRAGETSV
jgi:CBS domain-containing protein